MISMPPAFSGSLQKTAFQKTSSEKTLNSLRFGNSEALLTQVSEEAMRVRDVIGGKYKLLFRNPKLPHVPQLYPIMEKCFDTSLRVTMPREGNNCLGGNWFMIEPGKIINGQTRQQPGPDELNSILTYLKQVNAENTMVVN